MRYFSLYVKYGITFILYGLAPFLSKYYGEIGLSNSQIGILTSIPMIIAMLFVPILGSISDRIPRKKYMCAAELLIMGITCFLFQKCGAFLMMLLVVILYSISGQAETPVCNAIAIEYCDRVQKPFGPVRMTGSLGYQAAALLVAVFMPDTLKNLYPVMGIAAILAAGAALLLPDEEKRSRSKVKVPFSELFRNEQLRTLYILCTFCLISNQFYVSFFTKHMGDLGLNNARVSVLTLIATIMELPFLFMGDRISRKTTVWNWFRLGMLCSGFRFMALGLFRQFVPLFLVQLLGFMNMFCFEFVPQLYIGKVVRKELSGSAYSLLDFASFGVTRLFGSLLGGFLAEWIGIAPMFCVNGVLLMSGLLWFRGTVARMNRMERKTSAGVPERNADGT